MDSGKDVLVWGGDTYQPNGNITTTDLDIIGTLTATDDSSITVSGDFTKTGTFTANKSTVIFNDNSLVSTLSGSTAFYNLSSSTSGKVLTFTRGTTQTVTNSITLNGVTLNDAGLGAIPKLTVNSGATQSISNVSVTNNDASGGIKLEARGSSSLSGTTTNWVLGSTGTIFTWTGAVSGDWNTATNWDIGLVPSSTDTVIIPSNAANWPVLTNAITLEKLQLNSGSVFSTGGNALTIKTDTVLGGTLNASNSVVTIQGNLTSLATGTLRGTDPVLSSYGYVGTRENPLTAYITGTLILSAEGVNDYTSVSVKGTGAYRINEPIRGFVFINNTLQPFIGQQEFRVALFRAENAGFNFPNVIPNAVAIPGTSTIAVFRLPATAYLNPAPFMTYAGPNKDESLPLVTAEDKDREGGGTLL